MAEALQKAASIDAIIQKVALQGDLSPLSPAERWEYYKAFCAQYQLDPMTLPFNLLKQGDKTTLYPNAECSTQLARKHRAVFGKPEYQFTDGVVICTVAVEASVEAYSRTGYGVGAVNLPASGDARANAIMKAHTKAMRRGILRLVGISLPDESEIETIPNARTQAIEPPPDAPEAAEPEPQWALPLSPEQRKQIVAACDAAARISGVKTEKAARAFVAERIGAEALPRELSDEDLLTLQEALESEVRND